MAEDINIIVAIGKDGSIGREGNLIWKISDDLKRFKSLTMGHPVIMGRKTWDSLPKRPLPGRRNIVLTRNKNFKDEGCEPANGVEEALTMCENESPFIIGGAEIYKYFLPMSTKLYLTRINSCCSDADAFLELDLSKDWELEEASEEKFTEEGVAYQYQTFRRKGNEAVDNK